MKEGRTSRPSLTCTPMALGTSAGKAQSVGKKAEPNDTARNRFKRSPGGGFGGRVSGEVEGGLDC